MIKRLSITAILLLGGSILTGSAQKINHPQERIFIAQEASQLKSPIGVLEALAPIYKDYWKLTDQNEEARYLDAIARSAIQSSDAELKLLHFIENHPHSAYIHHAMNRMGEFYYVRGQFGSASYWFKQVNSDMLPEKMAESNDYYLAYSLMMENRTQEAIKVFRPLVYAPHFKNDASFYLGYLLMKEGALDEATPHLQRVTKHRLYGTYAQAYLAEAQLSKMRYSDALKAATEALTDLNATQEVKVSLYRTAGLAAAQLGQLQPAANHLTKYMQMSDAPGRIEQLTLGKTLFELGKYKESINYLNKASLGKQDFMSQLSLYYMGLAYLSLKQPQEAMSAFDQSKAIAAHAPITEAASYNAALSAYAQKPGQVGSGSQRLAGFLTEYPQSEYRSKVVNYLKDAFLNEPNADVAISEMDKITPLPTELAKIRERVRLHQANKALKSGETAVATKRYDEIIRSGGDPISVAEAHLWKGEAAYRSGDFQAAITSTQNYLKNKPEELELNPNAYYTLGYAYYNLRNYNEAERNFQEYIRINQNPTPNEKTAINNRLGDIQLQRKAYAKALDFYQQAELAGGEEADFALFNQGMIKGLQRDYQGKSSILGNLVNRYPSSKLVPEAMYEQGRSFTMMGNNSAARNVFEQFFNRHSRNPFAPRVGLQWALSYFNEGNLSEAAKIYKRVVRDYPNTPEAKSALQDLKSISVQLNQVEDLNELAQSVGAGEVLSRAEMDSLTFLAAERLVGEGKFAKANEALDNYLKQYPDGAFINQAHYNRALLQYNQGNYREATEIIHQVANRFSGTLAVDSYKLLASSYDRLKEPGKAAEAYLNLATLSSDVGERSRWIRASADRAASSDSKQFIFGLANDLASGAIGVNEETKSIVFGYAADSYARSNQKTPALNFARKILSLPDFGNHPMAHTIVGLDLMDQGKYKEVKSLMTKVTDKGSTNPYWLARAFILLADSYSKLGDKATAKAYLESVKSSYDQHDDGILEMVNNRLASL